MGRSKTRLPDRWLDYSMIGKQISGIPIIPCKLPLDERFLINKGLERDQWFTPDKLIEMVPNVGSIIDLTATDKYYNPALFTTRGIRHTKIGCGGRGTIPFEAIVHRFFDVVDAFFLSAHSRGKVLMVHCTHGLNRTGYLVSRYLVERRGFRPEDAIRAFNQARGHNIERHNYLDDLRQKSDRVCRNPIPLFQKSGTRPGHQEPTAASDDPPTSSNSHHLAQGGRSGTHEHPPPFPDYHQPPPVAQSYNKQPSFATQPYKKHPAGPRNGQHEMNCKQGPSSGPRSHYAEVVNSQGKNNSPLPPTDNSSACHQRPAQHPYAPAPVVPWVPVHDYTQPPPPIINKLPNLRRVVTDSFPVQLTNNFGDRPNSANRSQTDVQPQSASRSQNSGASPVDAGRRKQKSNRSNPPPASPSEQRRENRHLRFDDQSVGERSTSSTGISPNCNRVDPPGQHDGRRRDLKVHSYSSRSSHRDRPYDRPAKSSSSYSRQDFSPDRGAPRKKERSKRDKDGGGSAERS